MSDDFYVGYVPKMPPGLAAWIARVVAGLGMLAVAVAVLLATGQPPFAQSKFEFGVLKDYSGVIEEWPYPILRTSGGSYLLVAPGKHGLTREVKGLQSKTVHLRGALIERGADRMLEVGPESMQVTSAALASTEPAVSLGNVTLRGEIVDSKCYLGVMNPGEGKVHRDCAVRCISGGAPPAFIARDASGETKVVLLVGADGRQLSKEILPFVGEPVQVSGELVRSGRNLILKAEPATLTR